MNSKNSTIIFCFGILIIGAITNPDYEDHKREVTRAIIPETEIDANDPWGTLGQSLGSRMAGGLLDKYFSVSNYVVLSVGRIKYQGNKPKPNDNPVPSFRQFTIQAGTQDPV